MNEYIFIMEVIFALNVSLTFSLLVKYILWNNTLNKGFNKFIYSSMKWNIYNHCCYFNSSSYCLPNRNSVKKSLYRITCRCHSSTIRATKPMQFYYYFCNNLQRPIQCNILLWNSITDFWAVGFFFKLFWEKFQSLIFRTGKTFTLKISY